jgi:hypothetical protein
MAKLTLLDLKEYPFYKDLSYEDLIIVKGLLERGASPGLVYLWFNITHGMYNTWGGADLLAADKKRYKETYREFANDIDEWKP